MSQGARTDLSPIGERSQPEAAKRLNVSERSVQRAVIIGDKTLRESCVINRRISLSVISPALADDRLNEQNIATRISLLNHSAMSI